MKLLAVLFTALAAAVAPTATTGPPESVTSTGATVSGTVNPGGDATTYWVEIGRTTAYGLRTAGQPAGDGTDPVPVTVTLSALTPNTTYHYRLVASNAEGTARGADMTLRTARVPAVGSRAARNVTTGSATLVASVNPEREATGVHFEYGPSKAYGLRTADVAIGSGSRALLVSSGVGGLAPYTLYHFRAVATNATGVTHGPDRMFRTGRLPTAVTINLRPSRPVWGGALTVSGTVAGAGAAGTSVVLQRSEFPFGGAFVQVGGAHRASRTGHYAFTLPSMLRSARLRVVTRTSIAVSSPLKTATVALKVGLRVLRGHHRRVRITGAVWPAVPHGRASLQRLSRHGYWLRVGRRHRLSPLSGHRSRYTFSVRRLRSARTYRVVVDPRDHAAHARGTSRDHTLTGRR